MSLLIKQLCDLGCELLEDVLKVLLALPVLVVVLPTALVLAAGADPDALVVVAFPTAILAR